MSPAPRQADPWLQRLLPLDEFVPLRERTPAMVLADLPRVFPAEAGYQLRTTGPGEVLVSFTRRPNWALAVAVVLALPTLGLALLLLVARATHRCVLQLTQEPTLNDPGQTVVHVVGELPADRWEMVQVVAGAVAHPAIDLADLPGPTDPAAWLLDPAEGPQSLTGLLGFSRPGQFPQADPSVPPQQRQPRPGPAPSPSSGFPMFPPASTPVPSPGLESAAPAPSGFPAFPPPGEPPSAPTPSAPRHGRQPEPWDDPAPEPPEPQPTFDSLYRQPPPPPEVAPAPISGSPFPAPPGLDDGFLDGPTNRSVGPSAGPEHERTVLRSDLVGQAPPQVSEAILEFDTGEQVPVPVYGLLGRNPSPGYSDDQDVTLLPLDDPGRSVSKTHLAIGIGADGVWVVDRHSTNGVQLNYRGDVRRLKPGERVLVARGTLIAFGDRQLVVR